MRKTWKNLCSSVVILLAIPVTILGISWWAVATMTVVPVCAIASLAIPKETCRRIARGVSTFPLQGYRHLLGYVRSL